MGLNELHIHTMRQGLQVHEQRIAFLRNQVKLIEDEIAAHSLIVALGTDKNALEALALFANDPDAIPSGREREYAESSGIKLPEGSRIRTLRGLDGTLEVQVFTRTGEFTFSIIWHSRKGFSVELVSELAEEVAGG